jgi:hypothetical protein
LPPLRQHLYLYLLRLNAAQAHRAILARLLASFLQAEDVQTAEAHVYGPAATCVAKDPRAIDLVPLRLAGRHLQKEVVAVAIEPWFGTPQICAGESIDSAGHGYGPSCVDAPLRTHVMRPILADGSRRVQTKRNREAPLFKGLPDVLGR